MNRLALILWCAQYLWAQQDSSLPLLEREMARLARLSSGGVVGATAIHIETGRRVSLNARERFPMASTVKVPLAVHLLRLVDEGKERLDRMVTVEARDLHPGSGTLSDLFNKPGVSLSIRNLLELMLLISDNSATDMLLRIAGGPGAVTARMKSIGIEGLRADRSTALLIADAAGFRDRLPPEEQWTPQIFADAFHGADAATREAARKAFNEDPRDTSTPDAMAQLLIHIHRKDLLKPDTAELLLDIMLRCRTGSTRIKGILPAESVVAHKTGTITNSANDVGILELPGGAGHVALAAFVKKETRDEAHSGRAIAEIARAAFDYFLFHQQNAMNYEKLASRIVESLHPLPGERVYFRPDPGYFEGLLGPLREKLAAAGAVEVKRLDDAEIYLWLPLRPGGPGLPSAERHAVKEWTDKGGPRRQLHFHWGEGSVSPDGLYLEHGDALDTLYQDALDIDYKALGATQDGVIAQLKRGLIRVRTAAGTDMVFRTGDRPFNKQDGDASAARARAAQMRVDRDIELPAGVVRVAPVEETASGVVVIPEARFGAETARNIKLTFTRGRLTGVEAGENVAAVQKMLKEGGEAAHRFREFAIGLNPKLKPAPGARVLPYYGYGEGVVRLSLGDNEELGGNVRGGFVRWFFFPQATVEVNGSPLRY